MGVSIDKNGRLSGLRCHGYVARLERKRGCLLFLAIAASSTRLMMWSYIDYYAPARHYENDLGVRC
jgi:hypothetical protein